MNRTDFLKALELVSPALSTNALIPVLQHFWFTGKRLMAYNDQIAISTPLTTPFQGAVPGNTLLEMVRAITADNVNLEAVDGSTLKMTAGKGLYKLGLMAPDSYEQLFKMPALDDNAISSDEESFINGIKNCIRSVTNDTSVPEQLGVTVVPTDAGLDMFATDNSTLAHSKVSLKQPAQFKRTILSGSFCEQVYTLGQTVKTQQIKLIIKSDHSLFEAGATQLFGRLIQPHESSDLDFKAILKHHLPNGYKEKLWNIPQDDIQNIMSRACIITNDTVKKTRTKVYLKDEHKLRFFSKSERGVAQDELDTKTQGQVEINFDPTLLRTSLSDYDNILFTNQCVILTKDENIYLIGATKQ